MFAKVFMDADRLPMPRSGIVKRRIARDLNSGILLDDSRNIGKFGDRKTSKALKRRRNIDVEVELEVGEVTDEQRSWEECEMSSTDATRYRAVVARCNFLAIDRPDIMYASKECSRCMSKPVNGDWAALKRLGRYLISRPRVVHLFRWQERPTTLTAFSDSNWAGCKRTRKSTSGACYMHGSHLIKAFSRTQSNIALSSGEADFYSMVGASSEALGLKATTRDYDDEISPWLYVDASAAIGVAQRTGLGKIRHLDTQTLWLQQAVRDKRIGLLKVKGTENPADLMTKFVDYATLEKLMGLMGLVVRTGRADSAPQMAKDDTGVNAVDAIFDDVDLAGQARDLPEDGQRVQSAGANISSEDDLRQRPLHPDRPLHHVKFQRPGQEESTDGGIHQKSESRMLHREEDHRERPFHRAQYQSADAEVHPGQAMAEEDEEFGNIIESMKEFEERQRRDSEQIKKNIRKVRNLMRQRRRAEIGISFRIATVKAVTCRRGKPERAYPGIRTTLPFSSLQNLYRMIYAVVSQDGRNQYFTQGIYGWRGTSELLSGGALVLIADSHAKGRCAFVHTDLSLRAESIMHHINAKHMLFVCFRLVSCIAFRRKSFDVSACCHLLTLQGFCAQVTTPSALPLLASQRGALPTALRLKR